MLVGLLLALLEPSSLRSSFEERSAMKTLVFTARHDPDLLVGIVVGLAVAGSLYAGYGYELSRLASWI